MLRRALHADLLDRTAAAAADLRGLVVVKAPVLAHTGLQPANVLCDDASAWLLDPGYAALAPASRTRPSSSFSPAGSATRRRRRATRRLERP